MVVKGQFAEYRESLESDMKINLHDIRKEALMKMVTTLPLQHLPHRTQ
jgi:hypothetical protein